MEIAVFATNGKINYRQDAYASVKSKVLKFRVQSRPNASYFLLPHYSKCAKESFPTPDISNFWQFIGIAAVL